MGEGAESVYLEFHLSAVQGMWNTRTLCTLLSTMETMHQHTASEGLRVMVTMEKVIFCFCFCFLKKQPESYISMPLKYI